MLEAFNSLFYFFSIVLFHEQERVINRGKASIMNSIPIVDCHTSINYKDIQRCRDLNAL